MLYHPDKNSGDTTDKFQKITEAYNTLYDDEKRKNYDLYGTKEDFNDPFETFNNIFNDHLSNFMNMGMNYEKDINLNDILNNLTGINNLNIPDLHLKFQTYQKNNNEKIKNDSEVINENLIKPNTIYANIEVDLEDIYNKQEKEIIVKRTRKKNGKYIEKDKKIKVFLYDDEVFLENLGHEMLDYKLKGDIIINIIMKNHDDFKRINDYDLLYVKNIKLKEYYNDIEYELILPNKKKIKVINEKFDFNGNNLQKIKNYGIPFKKDDIWENGDLYIYYKICFPNKEELYDFVEEVYDEEDNKEFNNDIIIARNCSIISIF